MLSTNKIILARAFKVYEKEGEIWLSPMTKAPTQQKNPKSNVTTTNFDYTMIVDWLRTVSLNNNSYRTGVVKPINERSTFLLTASDM